MSVLKSFYKKINKNYQNEYLLKREVSFFSGCNNVLDVGCGDGEFIKLDSKRIRGIDTSKESISICRAHGLNASLGDAIKIPFKDNYFDGVHASHIIEHLYPKEAYLMLKEVGRVLKKNGIFVLSTPLLWNGFFEDFTHVKPYYPAAVLRYLVNDGAQKTLESYPYRFKEVNLYYRFRPLPLFGKLGKLTASLLYSYGIHSFKRDAYTLVLQKTN